MSVIGFVCTYESGGAGKKNLKIRTYSSPYSCTNRDSKTVRLDQVRYKSRLETRLGRVMFSAILGSVFCFVTIQFSPCLRIVLQFLYWPPKRIPPILTKESSVSIIYTCPVCYLLLLTPLRRIVQYNVRRMAGKLLNIKNIITMQFKTQYLMILCFTIC